MTGSLAVSRQFYEAYDRGDKELMERLLSPGCRVHLPGAPEPLSREAFLQISAGFVEAFAESHTTFDDQIAGGEVAVLRWTWQITHVRPYLGIAPLGKRVSVRGVTINQIAAGKIVEQWVYFDRLDLLQQLGAA